MSSTLNSGSSATLGTGLEGSNAAPAGPIYVAKPVQYIEARWYNDSPAVIKQGDLSSDEVGDFVKEKVCRSPPLQQLGTIIFGEI
jgi:hypothetical protein